MRKFTAAEVRKHFAGILEKVELGEAIGITKHGKWVATISKKQDRVAPPGWGTKTGWSGRMSGDFNAIPEDFNDYI